MEIPRVQEALVARDWPVEEINGLPQKDAGETKL
jgi:hypothetical protein